MRLRRPADIPARETTMFVAESLQAGARVLEIGCGDGVVAAELVRLGFTVSGLDADSALVARARARGVDATHARWPEYSGPAVDAVAFTRSLHHIAPLKAAVARARTQLVAGGLLLIEDFAFDEADATTIEWFLGVLRSAEARELTAEKPGEFASDLLSAANAVAAWRASHDHDLHRMSDIIRAVAAEFSIRELRSVPYLYRYLVPVLPENERAAAFLDALYREEAELAQQGRIVPIGRRILAR